MAQWLALSPHSGTRENVDSFWFWFPLLWGSPAPPAATLQTWVWMLVMSAGWVMTENRWMPYSRKPTNWKMWDHPDSQWDRFTVTHPSHVQLCPRMLLSSLRSLMMSFFARWRPSLRITASISYFALSLNTGNLHGDAYLNCFLSALVELPAYIVSWLLFRWCSRRLTLFFNLCLGGLFILFIQLIPASKTLD